MKNVEPGLPRGCSAMLFSSSRQPTQHGVWKVALILEQHQSFTSSKFELVQAAKACLGENDDELKEQAQKQS